MNAFDFSILSFLNRFEDQCPSFDKALLSLSAASAFCKAGLIVALYWWAWFKNGEDHNKNKDVREIIISAMLACVAAVIVIRLAVLAFPFRVRPLADPTNGLHFPQESFINWHNWSSFPSDHAIMFFTLTIPLFFISRVLGWIALLDSVFLVCLPRVFLGIHYPTDVLAGAAIGVGIGLLANQKNIKGVISKRAFQFMEKHPGLFYAGFFLFTCQVANMFSDSVSVGSIIINHLKKLLH
ncbi:MAG: phosphatase PAP2 family protein [Verrucomicrobiia bacterium]